MPKPSKDNSFFKNCVDYWEVSGYSFFLMENLDHDLNIKVFPHDDHEAFWLENGTWETESGAAHSILNYLDKSDK